MDAHMDYSNYKEDHPLYNTSKKSQLGYFKDELDCDSKCVELDKLAKKCIKKMKENTEMKLSWADWDKFKTQHMLSHL